MAASAFAQSYKLTQPIPIGGDGRDAAAFDPGTGTIFSSNGDGTLTNIKSIGNDRYEVVQNLTTEKGARTMALDSKTGAVYLSTAKLGPPPAPTPQNSNPPTHPTAIAGSFKVLVARPSRWP